MMRFLTFATFIITGSVANGGQLWEDVCTQEDVQHLKFCDASVDVDERVADYVNRIPSSAMPGMMVNGAAKYDDLHIPMYQWGSEGLHGPLQPCVTDPTTQVVKCPSSFPAASATATSFNDTLFKLIGNAIGVEARAINNLRNHVTQNKYGDGLDYWSPTVNMQRDPRWGRNQEVPGEDPTLTSRYAENYIQGIQFGEDPDHIQIIATCKHFIANSLENWHGVTRHNFNAQVPLDDLNDYYSVSFESCVKKGKALGIMCSYNAVNGIPMCANDKWLNATLRNTWGFDGYVTSDCGAISDVFNGHHYVKDGPTAAGISVTAGTDVDCGQVYGKSLAQAVTEGKTTQANVNQAFSRLTKMQMKLGLFDDKKKQPYFNYGIDKIDSVAHQQLALEASKQSIVLLKNDGNILPLKRGQTVAVIGPHFNATEALISNYHGDRCADSTFDCIETPLAAIAKANAAGTTKGVLGCPISGPAPPESITEAVALAQTADVVVLMVGIDQSQEREGMDRIITSLPGQQSELVKAVLGAKKPTVMVLINGGTISLGDLKDAVPGIIDAFYGGEMASPALASVLFGDTNPSGRMAATVYPPDYINEINLTQMAMKVKPGRTHLYYTGTPEFKFGDGLSYSSFATTLVTSSANVLPVEKLDGAIGMELRVSHVGGPAGKHTLLAFWRPVHGVVQHLRQRLFDYGSVILQPGDTSTIRFTLRHEHLAVAHGDDGALAVAPGEYMVVVYDGEQEVASHRVTVDGPRVVVTRQRLF
eukprot:m.1026122 g.1026122  ORF g.1026122 m.1026122 type:complete len:760 (+) comp24107_c2_seq13:156-2435(+)